MVIVTNVKKYIRSKAETNLIARQILINYREWIYRSGQKGIVTKVPFGILNVELTNKCPMKCVMCARTNNMTRSQGLMELETFKLVVDEYVSVNPERARTYDFWLHHFGESLVHPEFGKFIRYAVSKNMKVGLSINPIMLSAETSHDLLTSGISKLIVSLDGHDNESFLKIRGLRDAHEKSKTNFLVFLKMKKELNSKTRIILRMIDFKMNRESIKQASDFWKSIEGIDEFTVKNLCTWNGDAADVNALSVMKSNNEELRKVYNVVGCHNPWQQVSVTWDGEVVPCCYDYDKKYVLGDVKKESLSQIWNGERMQALRKEFLSNNVQNFLCRQCPVLYPPLDHKDDV